MKAATDGMVDSVQSLVKYKGFWLTHAPIHPDELRGKMNVHGHVHTKTLADNRYFNVSCENVGYKPVCFDDIKSHNPEHGTFGCIPPVEGIRYD
jgi:calcineurin-like phosphoesterase family protein